MRARSLKWIFLSSLLIILYSSCQTLHPQKVFVHRSLKLGTVEKIAVLPFSAAPGIPSSELRVACGTMDNLLHSELDGRMDYKFIPATTVVPALEAAGLQTRAEQWIENWTGHQEIDGELFDELSQILRADAVLVGMVDRWEKMEVQEETTPATIVGASIAIIEMDNGITLYDASDEDYLEGERARKIRFTTFSSKGIPEEHIRTRGGEAPPDQIVVAEAVVKALVAGIPVRKKDKR